DFENVLDISKGTGSLPFMAAVVIDRDGDGRDEAFLGGGRDQADGLFAYNDNARAFINVAAFAGIEKPKGDATMGGGAIDLDGDALPELFVARESGVWLYR
ncbi:MAG TPA: CRTAC1 family protein, partial [Parvularcula sp.]|nr:CRTAC1 family protein [Parvularcula sp.]